MPKKKLTEIQLRIAMGVAGILSAAALIASLYLSGSTIAKDDLLLQYLFVIVFIAIMFIRRRIEVNYKLSFSFFNLVLINGILVGILTFFIPLFKQPGIEFDIDANIRLIIIAAISLMILVLGIGLPLKNYYKRKANGTLKPIRLPEEKPEDKDNDAGSRTKKYSEIKTGPQSIAQQIAEMTRELEEQKSEVEVEDAAAEQHDDPYNNGDDNGDDEDTYSE